MNFKNLKLVVNGSSTPDVFTSCQRSRKKNHGAGYFHTLSSCNICTAHLWLYTGFIVLQEGFTGNLT